MNTLTCAKKLESVGFSTIQAETLAQLQHEKNDEFITKDYLSIQLKNLENTMIKWMIGISFAQLAIVFTVMGYISKP